MLSILAAFFFCGPSFGSEYKLGHVPIEQASALEQKYGKAVAYVDSAAGYSGTGFFISEDGLFLTNEHVVPHDSCSRERCAGFRIIRNLARGGDIEVFSRFSVIRHSTDLFGPDLAILKVELPPGRKVPFLKLATEEEIEALRSKSSAEFELSIIGHPLGGPLHAQKSELLGIDDRDVIVTSNILPGNSGSPLVDLKSGLAYGVVSNAGFIEADTVTMDGTFRSRTRVIRADQLIELSKNTGQPRARGELIKTPVDVNQMLAQYYGTPLESAKLLELLTSLSKGGADEASSALGTLYLADIKRGQSVDLSADGVREKLVEMKLTKHPFYSRPLLDRMPVRAEELEGKNFREILKALHVRPIFQFEAPRIVKVLKRFEVGLTHWHEYAEIDLAIVLLEKNSELLGPDSMKDSYPSFIEDQIPVVEEAPKNLEPLGGFMPSPHELDGVVAP